MILPLSAVANTQKYINFSFPNTLKANPDRESSLKTVLFKSTKSTNSKNFRKKWMNWLHISISTIKKYLYYLFMNQSWSQRIFKQVLLRKTIFKSKILSTIHLIPQNCVSNFLSVKIALRTTPFFVCFYEVWIFQQANSIFPNPKTHSTPTNSRKYNAI